MDTVVSSDAPEITVESHYFGAQIFTQTYSCMYMCKISLIWSKIGLDLNCTLKKKSDYNKCLSIKCLIVINYFEMCRTIKNTGNGRKDHFPHVHTANQKEILIRMSVIESEYSKWTWRIFILIMILIQILVSM